MISLNLLIGTIFATFALGFSLWGLQLIIGSARCKTWPSTQATMTQSEITKRHDDEGVKLVTVQFAYRYTVNGRPYEADTLQYRRAATSQYPHQAVQLLNKYPLGSEVPVYYNPQNPQEAVLEPITLWKHGGTLVFIGTSLLFIGLFMGL